MTHSGPRASVTFLIAGNFFFFKHQLMNNHWTLHVIRSCVYSKVHDLPASEGKLDNTGKVILRQHSYKHTKVHVGTYRQVSLVHKKHSASESKWLCIFVLKSQNTGGLQARLIFKVTSCPFSFFFFFFF